MSAGRRKGDLARQRLNINETWARALSFGSMASKKKVLTTEEVERIRLRTARAIAPLRPARGRIVIARGDDERTLAGQKLPAYYLVYFLLIELLKFPQGGGWEKVAWSIPVDFDGNRAFIEYRKMGLGVFSRKAPEDEVVAAKIVAAVMRGVAVARPFFDHLAAKAASGSKLNVTNNSPWLFSRYVYLRDQFQEKLVAIKNESLDEAKGTGLTLPGGIKKKSFAVRYADTQEARWIGIAAVEAFFSWTEHVLIHIAILLGKVKTGDDVAAMADSEWSDKVKKAIDLSADNEMRSVYEELLEIRRQVRNYMAHGAFGKNGEAFQFHTATGAVPVNINGRGGRGFSMLFSATFEESHAIEVMESFIDKLWQGERLPAKAYVENRHLPVILSHASDGIYREAMSSEETMTDFINYLSRAVDDAANMEW